MSILDDAIREHLELKRAHGADEAELKKLEDEAFGPPGRPDDPDPFAEAPTEFLAAPATDAGEAAADAAKGGRRAPNIADLQEAPPPPGEEPDAPSEGEKPEPAAEEQPAMEQRTMPVPHDDAVPPEEPEPSPEIDAGHSTEERHAIAEQPTELFDVEADIDAGSEPRSPSDEELVDSQISEPRLAPLDPLAGLEETGPDAEISHAPADEDEEDDDFFSEQRLSDELNQALEAPVTDEHPAVSPSEAAAPTTDEHAIEPDSEEHALGPESDEHALAPDTDEHERPAIPTTEEGTAIYQVEDHDDEDEDEEPASEEHEAVPAPKPRNEDVLEDTPDFLEDAPEDDNLWFEQQPPKDFDFDD
jgi:hypothetical protein